MNVDDPVNRRRGLRAWLEKADYSALQAKRMMAVINLITANGKMTCVMFEKLNIGFVCLCVRAFPYPMLLLHANSVFG